jgi:hypothetical protein
MTNIDLRTASPLLGAFPCSGLGIDKIKKVLELHNRLKSKLEAYEEIRKKIFQSYNILTDEDYMASKDVEKISKEITELDEEPVDLPDPVLTEDEVLQSVESMKGINVRGTLLLLQLLTGQDEI